MTAMSDLKATVTKTQTWQQTCKHSVSKCIR